MSERFPDFEAQIIGETALNYGTGWTDENLINIRGIIAKTARLKDAEMLELAKQIGKDNFDAGVEAERERMLKLLACNHPKGSLSYKIHLCSKCSEALSQEGKEGG